MNVEIINTSDKPVTSELENLLQDYAPYHIYEEQRNRIVIQTTIWDYDIRAIFVKVDENHVTIWISDWYTIPRR